MTYLKPADVNHKALFSSHAKDDRNQPIRSHTAEALRDLGAAIRYDTLLEAGLVVDEFEAVDGWYDAGARRCATATDYDRARSSQEAGYVEWVDAMGPRTGEAPWVVSGGDSTVTF